jgi:hydrophobic/amphiphilic exporter-1 (mainly G- bacteria), HAE1 family
MSLSEKVVKRPVLVTVAFSLVVIVAIYSIGSVPMALMPTMTAPSIMVNTTYTGAGPEIVERAVTKVLEGGLSNVQGVKSMTSTSSDQTSSVTLEFVQGHDLDKAANDIRDKLDSVRDLLPDGCATPTVFKFDSTSQSIIKIAVKGDRSSEELRALATDSLESRFAQTDGVSKVSVIGGRDKIVHVDLSQNRLAAYGLTADGIVAALSSQNIELGAGKIVERDTEYAIKTTGAFSDIDSDIANARIAVRDGVPIRLKDVATVASGYADSSTAVLIDGVPGVYISIYKQSNKNTVSVANAVYRTMKSLDATLPSDVKLVIVDDSSTQIRDTIADLIKAIIEGALLTMGFVFLFLRSWRSTLVVGIAIPICVLVTLLAVYFAGFTLNMMTMTGLLISIGNIVDSSIVILDNTHRYRERGAKPTVAAILGSQEMMMAISAGILSSLSVFLPILIFKDQIGIVGQLFSEMIFTIIISHLVSWVVAIFLVPVLSSHYLPVATRSEKPLGGRILPFLDRAVERAIDGLVGAYRKGLSACLRHRGLVVGAVFAALAGSAVILLPRLTIVFSPPMAENSITLSIVLPLGTRFEGTQTVVDAFAEISRKELRGAQTVIATTGSSGGFQSTDRTNEGSVTVTLPGRSKRVDGFDDVKRKLRAHFKEYPQANLSFQQGMRMSSRSDIDITITSTNYDGMAKTSKELIALMKAKVPEVLEPQSDYENGLPQIDVAIDRQRASSFGVSIQSIATELRDSIKGQTATVYRKGGDEYDVVVRLRPADRKSMLDLERIFVLSQDGKEIPLSSLASLSKGTGPVSIRRTNQARTIDITGSLSPGKQANVVEQKIRALVKSEVTVPSDVHVSFTGSWTEVTSGLGTFGIIIALSILLVFCVMAGQYESFKDPIINLFTIPLMLVGVLVAYAIRGQDISMFTLVGVVMLIGIVVNNGILLVDYTNLLRERGMKLMEACISGGASRFRPVVMTAGATVLGVVPMAFFPSDSSTITQPIGLAVAGGLISATFITLFLIPVVYYLMNQRQARKEGTL